MIFKIQLNTFLTLLTFFLITAKLFGQDSLATVYVYWPSKVKSGGYELRYADQSLGVLKPNNLIQFTSKPGSNLLKAAGKAESSYRLILESGKTYYISSNKGTGTFADKLLFHEVSDEVAQKEMVEFINSPFNNVIYPEEITSIDLKHGVASEVQPFISNDTLSLAFVDKAQTLNLFRIPPQGTPEGVFCRDVSSATFCGYQLNQAQEYFYFFEKSAGKTNNLYAIHIDHKTKSRELLKGIVIENPIVDFVNDDGVSIVTYSSKTRLLEVITVSEYTLKNKETVAFSGDLMDVKASDFDVISNNSGWFYEAANRFQVYIDKNFIRVSFFNSYSSGATVVSYDRVAKRVTSRSFRGPEAGEFKVAVTDSLVFGITTSRQKFILSVFSLSDGRLISQKEILKDSVPRDKRVYFYEGRKERKSQDEMLWHTLRVADLTEPAIMARKVSPGKYCFSWGTFFNEKGAGFVFNPNPLAMVVGSLVWTAMKQARKGPSVSRYLYSSFQHGKIEVDLDNDSVQKKIDDYEIRSKEKDVRYLIKNSRQALGFVAKSNKIQILKFGE